MKSIYRSEQGRLDILAFYEKVLIQWPSPSEQEIIETSLGKTFVITTGEKSKPSILMLHGSSSNSAMWMADAKTLSKDYYVITIDIPGECGNSSENRQPLSGGQYTIWLREIINDLDITTFSLVSNSLGSRIAIDFCIQYPEIVKHLILLAPGGITAIKPSLLFWLILTSLTGKWGFKKLNSLVYAGLDIDPQALHFAALVKNYYKPRTDPIPIFSDSELQQLSCPTLFIGGEKDCFYPSEKSAERITQNCTNSSVRILKETGHVLVNQSPLIRNFIQNGTL